MAVLKHSPSEVTRVYHDLLEGLNERPRRIPSKYFYDDEGSRLFERITETEDYYPTRCELEILKNQSRDILTATGLPERLNVVEIGAGDGRKTSYLLKEALSLIGQVTYRPVDISKAALEDLEGRFHRECPGLTVKPAVLDIDHDLARLPLQKSERNLVIYLGSSLGNFTPEQQKDFLTSVRQYMKSGDFLLLGFDLKKDAAILERAYDDRAGVTREFNMNLLRRLNREVGSDFSEGRFEHKASYNPATGAMESWLVSREDQTVHFRDLDLEVRLDAFEAVHVETSWKYSPREIRDLARTTGYLRVASFYDHRSWFVDELWVN